MGGLTRRFAVAGAIAFLIGLAGVREAHAQHRSGSVMHSGGGGVQFSGGSFHGATGVGHSFSTGTQFFSTGQRFSTFPQFVGGRGFVTQPFFFGGSSGTFSPSLMGGSSPGYYYAFPYTSSGYSAPPNNGAVSYSSLPPTSAMMPSTVTQNTATPNTATPNTVTTVSYGTDDSRGDTAVLHIQLPANASLFFNGVETTGQLGGRARRYVTPSLLPGETYKFVLRAEWMENGRTVERSREVKVEAGDVIGVDFNAPPA